MELSLAPPGARGVAHEKEEEEKKKEEKKEDLSALQKELGLHEVQIMTLLLVRYSISPTTD